MHPSTSPRLSVGLVSAASLTWSYSYCNLVLSLFSAVNAVDTDGTINGRDPLDAITLSDAQDWPGSVTFSQLEVTEELQVDFLSFLRFCVSICMSCIAAKWQRTRSSI